MWSFFCIVPSFQGIYFDNLCQLCFQMSCIEKSSECVMIASVYLCVFIWTNLRECENIASCDGTVN